MLVTPNRASVFFVTEANGGEKVKEEETKSTSQSELLHLLLQFGYPRDRTVVVVLPEAEFVLSPQQNVSRARRYLSKCAELIEAQGVLKKDEAQLPYVEPAFDVVVRLRPDTAVFEPVRVWIHAVENGTQFLAIDYGNATRMADAQALVVPDCLCYCVNDRFSISSSQVFMKVYSLTHLPIIYDVPGVYEEMLATLLALARVGVQTAHLPTELSRARATKARSPSQCNCGYHFLPNCSFRFPQLDAEEWNK
jgi:hypothetical protein